MEANANWWANWPWRMIQTNLNEKDMLDIDADGYVAEMKRFGATLAMINAAGIIASYPTRLPFHFQSPYLQGDSLRQIIEKCHEAGIKVIARTDFSKIRMEVYESHPEWACRRADGEPVVYNGDVHACLNGGYQQEREPEILRELLTTLDFDGVFYNMAGFHTVDYSYHDHGICHCDACKARFREMFGLELPVRLDMGDPVYRKYRLFTERCAKEHDQRLYAFVKELKPGLAVAGHEFQRIESNTEISRPLPAWQYSASSNTRCGSGTDGVRVPSNTSVDFIGFPYRHIAVSPYQQELREWQNLANRGGLDYYIMGRLDRHRDRSGFAAIEKTFRFHQEHERQYQGLRSAARVLLLRTALWTDTDEVRGWIRALSESHIPFDEVLTAEWTRGEQLTRYELVVLGDVKYLSDAQIGWLDAYAEGGGTVLATGESACYDERYEARGGCALRCLGIRRMQFHETSREQLSAMFMVEGDRDAAVFPHFNESAYVMPGWDMLYAGLEDDVETYLKLIPRHPFGPPERCYYDRVTDRPGVTARPFGKGKGVWVPFKPGSLYYTDGHLNSLWFMRDVLTNLCGAQSLGENLCPQVEATLSAGDKRMVAQLVNGTGHFGNTFFAPLPVEGVCLRIPVRGKALRAYRISDGKELPWVAQGDAVSVTLERLEAYEGVVVETDSAQ